MHNPASKRLRIQGRLGHVPQDLQAAKLAAGCWLTASHAGAEMLSCRFPDDPDVPRLMSPSDAICLPQTLLRDLLSARAVGRGRLQHLCC